MEEDAIGPTRLVVGSRSVLDHAERRRLRALCDAVAGGLFWLLLLSSYCHLRQNAYG